MRPINALKKTKSGTIPFTCYLPDDTFQRIDALAESLGIRRTELGKMILTASVNNDSDNLNWIRRQFVG